MAPSCGWVGRRELVAPAVKIQDHSTMTDNVSDIPEDELGVELDAAIDTAVEADLAAKVLGTFHVRLDGAADSNNLPPAFRSRLRELQDETQELMDRADAIESTRRKRADRIRKRMENDE